MRRLGGGRVGGWDTEKKTDKKGKTDAGNRNGVRRKQKIGEKYSFWGSGVEWGVGRGYRVNIAGSENVI